MARGKRDPDTPFLSQTSISAKKTAAEIQELLGQNGARRVMTEYEDGETKCISFTIMIQDKEVLFRIPVRWQQYLEVLKKAAVKKRGNAQVDPEQARRTAWRIAKALLEAQLAVIKADMAEIPELMLSNIVHGEQTLYEHLSQTGFLLEHKP